MNRFSQFALLSMLLLALSLTAVQAQRNSDVDRYFDESQGFKHKLWYGGGIALGFSGGNFNSLFQIGLSPLVGYKFTENLSFGPRFSVLYSHYRQELGNGAVGRANMVDYGIGAFTRYKVIRGFFIHLEYGADNQELLDYGRPIVDNEIPTFRSIRSNAFVGAGYNDGNGLWGYDIYILYNVLLPENDFRTPFDIRFGVTYNF